MFRTLEAVIEQDGHVRLLEAVRLPVARRALITILDESPAPLEDTHRSAGDVASAAAAIHQTEGAIALDGETSRWVAEDKTLEYGGADT